jgi:hypothetical protein
MAKLTWNELLFNPPWLRTTCGLAAAYQSACWLILQVPNDGRGAAQSDVSPYLPGLHQ